MGSGKNLTSEEKYAIDVLAGMKLSYREIAVSIEHSRSAVASYLKNKNGVRASKVLSELCLRAEQRCICTVQMNPSTGLRYNKTS